MTQTDTLILGTDIKLGRRVKVARMLKGWRQIDLAAFATEWLRENLGGTQKITAADVSWLETDWRINHRRRQAICAVLGLKDPDAP